MKKCLGLESEAGLLDAARRVVKEGYIFSEKGLMNFDYERVETPVDFEEDRRLLSSQKFPLDKLRRLRNQKIMDAVDCVFSESFVWIDYLNSVSMTENAFDFFAHVKYQLDAEHPSGKYGTETGRGVIGRLLEEVEMAANQLSIILKEDWKFCRYFAYNSGKS